MIEVDDRIERSKAKLAQKAGLCRSRLYDLICCLSELREEMSHHAQTTHASLLSRPVTLSQLDKLLGEMEGDASAFNVSEVSQAIALITSPRAALKL